MAITNEMEWLEARQHGIGSTDSPVLALEKKKVFNKTPVDTYISKKQPIKPMADGNYHFRRGHTYEPLACALFEMQEGVKVYAPRNDEERYGDFMLWHPDVTCMFTDLDGYTEDGWIVEVKSPMQMTCDKYRAMGIPENYLVQGQHHIAVARAAGLPNGLKGDDIKGVIFVIFEPEKVQLQVVRVPTDDDMIAVIEENARHFWETHIIPGVPPVEDEPKQPIQPKGKKGTYTEVDGEQWISAVASFKLAKELEATAKRRLDLAEATILKEMEAAGEEAVVTKDGYRFSNKDQAGRSAIDFKALVAAHPNIDLDKFKKRGEPFKVFRKYGPKTAKSDAERAAAEATGESMDSQLITLHDELMLFAKTEFTTEEAVEEFDELRGRAELYTRVLSMELEGIEKGLHAAQEAVVERMKTGGTDG